MAPERLAEIRDYIERHRHKPLGLSAALGTAAELLAARERKETR